MLRTALALLLLASCWQPAAAGAVAQVVASRGAASSVVPVISAGAPLTGLPGASLSGFQASLTGGWSPTLPPALSVTASAAAAVLPSLEASAAGVRSLSAAPRSLPSPITVAAPGTTGSSSPPALAAVVQASGELSRTAAPRGGSSSASAAARAPVLDRLFDGGVRVALPEDPVDATLSLPSVPRPALDRAGVTAQGQTQVPAAASAAAETQRKASRQALIGTAIYKFGMESLGITMPLVALTVFGSAVWMATMAVGWGVSMTAASMFAGGLIDRKPVQKVLAGALATQAVAVGGIIALLTLGLANPWLVLPLYSLAGFTQGMVLTARGILPTRILGNDEPALGKFNSKTHIIYEVAGTIAPLLVGLLISKVGLLSGLFLLPPAYLLAALVFSRLKLDPALGAVQGGAAVGLKKSIKRAIADVREGARIMMGSTEFRWLGILMVGPMVLHRIVEQILTPIFAKSLLHAPAAAALIISGGNLGECLGAVLLLRSLMHRGEGQKPSAFRWVRLMALAGLGAWAFLTGSLWLVLPTVLAMGLTFSANDIGLSSYFQSRLPVESAGKAMGFMMAVELGSIMAGSYLLGFLFDLLPLGAALAVVGAAFAAMIPLFYRGYGRLRSAQKPKA